MESAKGLIITGVITLVILIGGIFLVSKGGSNTNQKPTIVDSKILVRDDSHQTATAGANPKVTIVEFGDYRCPACKQAYPVAKQLISDYGSRINFVFRNFAFLPDTAGGTTTNASTLAANSAECASDQNKFWEMHDYLYQNQPDESDIKMYTIDNMTKAVGTLGMNTEKFKQCLSNKTHDDRVKADYVDGQVAGVTGTPTFYINGQKIPGVPTLDQFKSVVDALLK